MIENTTNKPSKVRTKNGVEVSDHAHGTCNKNSGIKIKTMMLKSGLWDYKKDVYKLEKGAITNIGAGVDGAARQACK